MKTIEEAVKEIVDKSLSCDRYNGISGMCMDISKKSIEFAQHWIPVEEELPETKTEANRLSKVVICKSDDLADEFTGYYDGVINCWRLYPSGERTGSFIKVTHWRPIELP